MKFIWEDGDMKSGLIVGKSGREERWMIGYIGSNKTPTMNSVIDGCVVEFESRKSLLDRLNKEREVPAKFLDLINEGE